MEKELDLFAPQEVEEDFKKIWYERYRDYVFPVPKKIIDDMIRSSELAYEYLLKRKTRQL